MSGRAPAVARRVAVAFFSAWAAWIVAALPGTARAVEAKAPASGPVELRFTVLRAGFEVGSTRWTLEETGSGTYRFRSETRSTGLAALLARGRLLEESVWLPHAGRPRPLRYRFERIRGKRRRSEVIRFDWVKGVALAARDGQPRSRVALPSNALDNLTYLLALRRDLSAVLGRFPRDPLALLPEYLVINGGRLKRYRPHLDLGSPEVRGNDTRTRSGIGSRIEIAGRQVRVFAIERASGPRRTVLWLAPALEYWPVRIDHWDRDTRVRLELNGPASMLSRLALGAHTGGPVAGGR